MDAFEHRVGNPQRNIPPLVARTSLSEHKHTRLVLKKVANPIGAQIPHFGDFRNGVVPLDDERDLLRDALRRSMGEATLEEVRNEFEKRVNVGEFIGVEPKPGVPDRVFTSQEMIDYERDTI